MILRELRIKYGMTQEELARKVSVNRATIALIEAGKNKPSVKLAKKLAPIFDINWADFFKD
ncbi:MAG: helix-turn-helix transcriptional regulator [Bullifex sp.]